MPIEIIDVEAFNQGTQIKVIGVGGGGSNAVEHMILRHVQGVEFVSANTDAQALTRSSAHRTIQLGMSGLGAGSKPDKGREAAEAASEDIKSAIQGAHMLFITAGMGGGTGTGAAPVIARIAKEMGILTVGVVTKPFDWEGKRRMVNADEGLSDLEANVDSLIVVLNEKLLEVLGDDITQEEAFAHANDVLKNAVGGIAEIINEYGQVNVDFEDVKTVMGEPGRAMMGTATASGPDRARLAAEQAVACPLLEGIDLSGCKGVLVLVTAARGSLKLSESRLAMSTINAYASDNAHVIYGAAYDDTLGDEIRVTVVATGLARYNARRQHIQVLQGGQRTGTDNMPYTMPTPMPMPATPMPIAASAATSVTGMAGGGGMGTASSSVSGGRAGYAGKSVDVWSSLRTQASAKVDALSSGGMNDLDIPAFLRKQAD